MFKSLKIQYKELFSKISLSSKYYDKAIDYFEEVLKRISLTVVAIYRQNGLPDKKINNELIKLTIPSMGDWNQFINIILKWYRRVKREKDLINEPILDKINSLVTGKLHNKELIDKYNYLLETANKSRINI